MNVYGSLAGPVLVALMGASSMVQAASAVVHAQDGTYGYSINSKSPTGALQYALAYCAARSQQCSQSEVTTATGYSAVVTGNPGFGYALAESGPETARAKAESACSRSGKECTLAVLWREELPKKHEEPSEPAADAP